MSNWNGGEAGGISHQSIYGSGSPKSYQPQRSVRSIGQVKLVSKVRFPHAWSRVSSPLCLMMAGQLTASVHVHREGVTQQLLLAAPQRAQKQFVNSRGQVAAAFKTWPLLESCNVYMIKINAEIAKEVWRPE